MTPITVQAPHAPHAEPAPYVVPAPDTAPYVAPAPDPAPHVAPAPDPAPRRDALLAGLVAGEADQRRDAARALAAWPEAAPALARRLPEEPDAAVREALLASLARIGDAGAAVALLPLLRGDDAALRRAALATLELMPDAAAPQLAALLADPDPGVRLFAVGLLRELRHAQRLPWLLQVLALEPLPAIVAAAVDVLAAVGGPEHVPALREARDRLGEDLFVWFGVDIAIERLQPS